MQEANKILHRHFLPAYNQRPTTRAFQPQEIYRRVPRRLDLDRVLRLAYEATVGHDNTVRIANLVLDIPLGPYRCSYARAKVTAHQLLNGTWRVYCRDQLLLERPATDAGPPLRTLGRSRAGMQSYQSWVALHSKPNHPEGDIFTQQVR